VRRPAALLVSLAALACAALPAHASLPTVASGHRPGPDALYAPPPDAPQLQNVAPWRAPPILVSGASAYRDGEYLYQDFLYDDHGAAGGRDSSDPFADVTTFTFAPTFGRITYPTDPVYANNAADFVELRVRPLADATAFRVTLNTLIDPERTAFTIALGSSGVPRAWPHGAGVRSPAELFLTVHGSAAELRDAASGEVRGPAPTASVDLARRQVDVRLPHAAFDPGEGTVRLAAGAGLWDRANGRYLQPQPGRRTAETPGGAIPTSPALFNMAFRFDEPLPNTDQDGGGVTIVDAGVGASLDGSWWRERKQAEDMRLGDVSAFHAEVDFAKLRAGVSDESGVPRTGPIDRILASRHEFGQGIDHARVCFDIRSLRGEGTKCQGRFVGQLQPYALYVPDRPRPARGWGLTMLLHSLAANHNQYLASKYQSQFGERGAGSLVATPGGRGPDGFYMGIPEADTFEVWADVARHYDVDPEWTAVSGYSMGGLGTFRMLARWPDLFARGMSTVGSGGSVEEQLASLRHTPIMSWAASGDELVPVNETEQTTEVLTGLRLRFSHFLFAASDHLTLYTNDEYGPAAEFLGEHRVDRDPERVTYVVDPREDSAPAQAVADHAYWLSGLRPRDPDAEQRATIDARSDGFGRGEPEVLEVERSAGAVQGGSHGPMPYDRRARDWRPAAPDARRDRLVVRATNLAAATVDLRRARLSCAPELDLRSDGPLDLRLGCAPAGGGTGAGRPVARCARTVTLRLPRIRGRRIVSVRVTRGRRTVKRVRGRDVRRVSVRRPTRRAFALRLRARTAGGRRARTITVLRRFPLCRRYG
jgi:hypothetical protein